MTKFEDYPLGLKLYFAVSLGFLQTQFPQENQQLPYNANCVVRCGNARLLETLGKDLL